MKNWLYILSVALAVAFTTPGVAAAADLGQRQYVSSEAPVVAKDWTGIYAGFLVGWSTADFNYDSTTTFDGESARFGFGSSDDQLNFGFQFGADKQYGAVVIGLAADISYMGLEGSDRTGLTAELSGDPIPQEKDFVVDHQFGLDYLATARVRLGYDVGGFLLPYITGGVAFGSVETQTGLSSPEGPNGQRFEFGSISTETQRWGYTVGAGLEAKLTENIRAKVEYLYVDLGDAETNVNALGGLVESNSSVELDLHLVRAGLAYQF